MKEAVFNTETVRSLKAIKFWAYKINDAPIFSGMKTRFTSAKPFDIVFLARNGRFGAIEGKQFKKWKGFTKKVLADHQILSLDEIVALKGKAYVFLNMRVDRENWLVVFDWKKYRARILSGGFPIKEMRARSAGEWIQGKKGVFDLWAWSEREFPSTRK